MTADATLCGVSWTDAEGAWRCLRSRPCDLHGARPVTADPTPAGLDLDAVEPDAGSIPDQPDDIDETTNATPDPARAADRIEAWLSEWGDGLIEVTGGAPLYARDLAALATEVRRAWSAVAIAQDWEQHGPREWDPAVIQGLLDNLDGLDDEHRQPGDRCRSATGDHLRALLARVRQLDAENATLATRAVEAEGALTTAAVIEADVIRDLTDALCLPPGHVTTDDCPLPGCDADVAGATHLIWHLARQRDQARAEVEQLQVDLAATGRLAGNLLDTRRPEADALRRAADYLQEHSDTHGSTLAVLRRWADELHPTPPPRRTPMSDRPWTDEDRRIVARTIHDHACPSDPDAGCNWTEDGAECRMAEFEGFADAVLAALAPRHGDPATLRTVLAAEVATADNRAEADRLHAQVAALQADKAKLVATIAAYPDAGVSAANLAHARMERDELRRQVAELKWAEILTEQGCAEGRHTEWYADTENLHTCPWCEADRLRGELAYGRNQLAQVWREFADARQAGQAMRPVVEAAIAWRSKRGDRSVSGADYAEASHTLVLAVDGYDQQPEHTADADEPPPFESLLDAGRWELPPGIGWDMLRWRCTRCRKGATWTTGPDDAVAEAWRHQSDHEQWAAERLAQSGGQSDTGDGAVYQPTAGPAECTCPACQPADAAGLRTSGETLNEPADDSGPAKPCDCSCHSCCVPADVACVDCEDDHPADTAGGGQT